MDKRDTSAEKESSAFSRDEIERIRRDFPILSIETGNRPLIYLDNAATTQKPRAVLDALDRFYRFRNANVHRGVHFLSGVATEEYEAAREKVQRFLGADSPREIIFTRGATEAINLVAQSYGRHNLRPGDEILITVMEHHSNIVPWQMLCEQTGARLRVAPINDAGEVLVDEFESLLNKRTKLVALAHMSNVLGTVNPIAQMTAAAHAAGAVVLVDGAQSAAHMPTDIKKLGCDFFACSGHKMYGPTGIGVLYGRAPLLERMPPWQGGGEMVLSVSFAKTVYNELPMKFEAGTPNVAGAVGLGAALDYVSGLGLDRVCSYERELLEYGSRVLDGIEGLRLIGNAREKAGVLSFVMDCAHAHDIGQILDEEGVAIRTGHHCAQPLMERLGIHAAARASVAFYNTNEEIDALGAALRKVKEVFA